MAHGTMRFRVTHSRRLLPMFAFSCMRPGACSRSKPAPLLGAIPNYGTSRACSNSGSRPEHVSFPSICAHGACNLRTALRASFLFLSRHCPGVSTDGHSGGAAVHAPFVCCLGFGCPGRIWAPLPCWPVFHSRPFAVPTAFLCPGLSARGFL